MPPPESDPPLLEVARASRPRPLFAAFSHRFANTGLEMFVILVLLGFTVQPLARSVSWLQAPVLVVILFVIYFAGFWASRFSATPFQMAGRLKVVDYQGRPLKPWRAVLRLLALLVLVGGATSIAATPRNPMTWAVAAPACALLFMAALTRRRQAAHDFLARSVVVYRRAFDAPDGVERLTAAVAGAATEPESGTWGRVGGLLRDLLMLLVPIVVVHSVAGVHFDRNLYGRVSYAVQHTSDLKVEVQTFFSEFGHLPSGPKELGISPTKTPYPDGGYYYLDDEGRIVIHFTVLPELTRGRLILTAVPGKDRLEWNCTQEGSIERAHLTRECRD